MTQQNTTQNTKKKTKRPSYGLLLGLGVCALALSACQTTGTGAGPNGGKMEYSDEIAAAIRRAENKSGVQPSLDTLEQRYKKAPDSEIAAAQFAYALRGQGHLAEAATILKPFADKEGSSAATKTEYANVLLAQGKLKDAEKTAQKAVNADDTYDRAYHTLGIALDAQGSHEQGERAFRKALELWQGDPTSVMNNLALNLASQNRLNEAAEILIKAKELAPRRAEIERNLRIVNALIQSEGAPAPKPAVKPPEVEKLNVDDASVGGAEEPAQKQHREPVKPNEV